MSGSGDVLKFITCGSVDDGKSTLIGHLLHRTGNIPSDQLATLMAESSRIGTAGNHLDYSLLMDGLLAEREQGITIDVSYRYFSATGRKFIVADTPGHEQYTRNMATGASQCDAALILVDVQKGIVPQTRRHALICALMGISHVLFVVNKMDRIEWDESGFQHVAEQKKVLLADLAHFGLHFSHHTITPVSALHGENLTEHSKYLHWYKGPTLLEWLLQAVPESWRKAAYCHLPVQYVIKISKDADNWQRDAQPSCCPDKSGTFRAYAGTVTSGVLSVGDEVIVQPSGSTTKIERIWSGDTEIQEATGGMSVAIAVTGEHDIVRGDLVSLLRARCEQADQFKVRVIWMDDTPLYAGRQYLFHSVIGTTTAVVTKIRNRVEPESYHRLATDSLHKNDIAELELHVGKMIPFDPYQENRETGAFILVDRINNVTSCCGTIVHAMRRSTNLHWQAEIVDRNVRAKIKGQKPVVIWLTGLSGSGKSTIANELESRLNSMGKHTMLLDGDNIRHGLNKDLGFTDADRVENIRRIGEVAKLMADAGLIVITAFISPFRAERDMVRALFSWGEFVEVYVNTPVDECERRDPKGLYKKAKAGLIPNFTGVNSPYEEPVAAEYVVDTRLAAPEDIAQQIIKNQLQLEQ